MDHSAYGTKCETFEDFTAVKFQIVSCNILYCNSGYMSQTRRPQSRGYMFSRIFGMKIFQNHHTDMHSTSDGELRVHSGKDGKFWIPVIIFKETPMAYYSDFCPLLYERHDNNVLQH
jgi:hypothetical protein